MLRLNILRSDTVYSFGLRLLLKLQSELSKRFWQCLNDRIRFFH